METLADAIKNVAISSIQNMDLDVGALFKNMLVNNDYDMTIEEEYLTDFLCIIIDRLMDAMYNPIDELIHQYDIKISFIPKDAANIKDNVHVKDAVNV